MVFYTVRGYCVVRDERTFCFRGGQDERPAANARRLARSSDLLRTTASRLCPAVPGASRGYPAVVTEPPLSCLPSSSLYSFLVVRFGALPADQLSPHSSVCLYLPVCLRFCLFLTICLPSCLSLCVCAHLSWPSVRVSSVLSA